MENKNLLMLAFLVAIFLGLLYGGEVLTGNFAKNADGNAAITYRMTSVLITSTIMAIIIFYMNRKALLKVYENKVLIFFWFAGITGFFFVVFIAFTTMVDTSGHRNIIIYEPSNAVYYSELTLMFMILLLTTWILYNYASGKASLELVRKKRR